jgi:hypothetical protein
VAEKIVIPEELILEPEVEEPAAAEQKVEAETVLTSTFIPRRIIQPREEGKNTIRFAEDIFSNRPGRSEDKHRKKRKKFTPGAGRNAGPSRSAPTTTTPSSGEGDD